MPDDRPVAELRAPQFRERRPNEVDPATATAELDLDMFYVPAEGCGPVASQIPAR